MKVKVSSSLCGCLDLLLQEQQQLQCTAPADLHGLFSQVPWIKLLHLSVSSPLVLLNDFGVYSPMAPHAPLLPRHP